MSRRGREGRAANLFANAALRRQAVSRFWGDAARDAGAASIKRNTAFVYWTTPLFVTAGAQPQSRVDDVLSPLFDHAPTKRERPALPRWGQAAHQTAAAAMEEPAHGDTPAAEEQEQPKRKSVPACGRITALPCLATTAYGWWLGDGA